MTDVGKTVETIQYVLQRPLSPIIANVSLGILQCTTRFEPRVGTKCPLDVVFHI